MRAKLARFCLGIVLMTACPMSGCAATVAPWERGNLAKPRMALEPDVLDAALARHTFGAKEGSSGGYGVGGGGCGCN
jgi:hypothetical protein